MMTRPEPDVALRALLAELSRAETTGIGPDVDLREALDLDSLAGLRMLASVERHFDVRFPDEQLSDLRTIRLILAAIAAAQPKGDST
jgi:acyl carrier protein